MREVGIMVRVPFLVVNAIQDADKVVLARLKEAFQSAAIFGGGDFARVTRADGGDQVCVGDSGFETIHLAVEFDAVGIKIIPRQIGKGVAPGRKRALIGEVVNGEAGSRWVFPSAG